MAAAQTPARRSLFEPHPTRLPVDHPRRDEVLAAHRAAIEAAQPGYLDPLGLFVITAAEHVRRGHCCANDCRHCPYR